MVKEEENGSAPGFGGGLLILPFTRCGCIIPPVGIIGVLSGSTESSKFCIRGASNCVRTDWPFICPIKDVEERRKKSQIGGKEKADFDLLVDGMRERV